MNEADIILEKGIKKEKHPEIRKVVKNFFKLLIKESYKYTEVLRNYPIIDSCDIRPTTSLYKIKQKVCFYEKMKLKTSNYPFFPLDLYSTILHPNHGKLIIRIVSPKSKGFNGIMAYSWDGEIKIKYQMLSVLAQHKNTMRHELYHAGRLITNIINGNPFDRHLHTCVFRKPLQPFHYDLSDVQIEGASVYYGVKDLPLIKKMVGLLHKVFTGVKNIEEVINSHSRLKYGYHESLKSLEEQDRAVIKELDEVLKNYKPKINYGTDSIFTLNKRRKEAIIKIEKFKKRRFFSNYLTMMETELLRRHKFHVDKIKPNIDQITGKKTKELDIYVRCFSLEEKLTPEQKREAFFIDMIFVREIIALAYDMSPSKQVVVNNLERPFSKLLNVDNIQGFDFLDEIFAYLRMNRFPALQHFFPGVVTQTMDHSSKLLPTLKKFVNKGKDSRFLQSFFDPKWKNAKAKSFQGNAVLSSGNLGDAEDSSNGNFFSRGINAFMSIMKKAYEYLSGFSGEIVDKDDSEEDIYEIDNSLSLTKTDAKLAHDNATIKFIKNNNDNKKQYGNLLGKVGTFQKGNDTISQVVRTISTSNANNILKLN